MKNDTALKLLALNHQFYQTFALQFSSTRMRLQPGVHRVLERLPLPTHLLDLGCGNGNLARFLATRRYQGTYLGLDNSRELLEQARLALPASQKAIFLQADLAGSEIGSTLSGFPSISEFSPFDLTVAFAVLHHLPGEERRKSLLIEARSWLAPGSRFVHSEWQFLHSPRWRMRIQPWEIVGLSTDEVDPGDYLLDWKYGGYGLRYVHHFSPGELESLAAQCGFSILETFHSDGEGGQLGLYQIWEPV